MFWPNKLKRFAWLMAVVCLLQSGSALAGTSEKNTTALDLPWKTAYGKIVEILNEEQFRITSGSTDQASLVAVREYPAGEMAQWVTEPLASQPERWWSLEVTVLIALKALSPNQTKVSVRTRMIGRENPAMAASRHRAPQLLALDSNGAFEQRLLNRLALLRPAI